MKKILILSLLSVLVLSSLAQTNTPQLTRPDGRTEFLNDKGENVGYAIFNEQCNCMDYYDCFGNLIKSDYKNAALTPGTAWTQVQLPPNTFKPKVLQEEIKDKDGNVIGCKKWNSEFKRYDLYDAEGKIVAYYIYNNVYDCWLFMECK